MHATVDHVLFAIVALIYPLYWKVEWHRRIRGGMQAGGTISRIVLYRDAMRGEWFLTALILGCWFLAERTASAIGFSTPEGWPFWAGVLVFVVYVIVGVRQVAGLRASAEDRAKARHQLRGDVALLIPRTPAERRTFFLLSLTAGICEEIAYRGFLIWYLSAWLPTAGAAAVAGAIFGVAHIYLGWGHVFRTGIVGLILAGIYVLTGSLWVPIALHAAVDVLSGDAGFVAFEDAPDTARRVI